jgi:hypothetical protein
MYRCTDVQREQMSDARYTERYRCTDVQIYREGGELMSEICAGDCGAQWGARGEGRASRARVAWSWAMALLHGLELQRWLQLTRDLAHVRRVVEGGARQQPPARRSQWQRVRLYTARWRLEPAVA